MAVSFSWDDGNDPQVTFVPSLLAHYGIKGTFYLSPAFLDPVYDAPTPDQLKDKWTWANAMYTTHEVGAHTQDHIDMSDARLSMSDLETQFEGCNARLRAMLKNRTIPKSFAWPFGRYSQRSKRVAHRVYDSVRTTECRGMPWRHVTQDLPSCEMKNSVAHNRAILDHANRSNHWVIFHGHGVESCQVPERGWSDVQLSVEESKHKNMGRAKARGNVSAIQHSTTGKVLECRHGWNPLSPNVVRKTLESSLSFRPWIAPVGEVYDYATRCHTCNAVRMGTDVYVRTNENAASNGCTVDVTLDNGNTIVRTRASSTLKAIFI